MTSVTSVTANPGMSAEGIAKTGPLKSDLVSIEPGDGTQFRAALERQMQAGASNASGGSGTNGANGVGGAGNAGGAHRPGKIDNSLGDKMIARAGDLAGEVKKDQQYVSKMLEQATRTGDSMQLMKAMMALNDYQMRVQFISKTASKATSSLDQLTKLQ